MIAAQSTPARGPQHGTARRKVPLSLQRDPVRLDRVKLAAARTVSVAAPSGKALQRAGAGSKQTASRWRTEGEGSPVLAHDYLILGLAEHPEGQPGVLVAHARATLRRAMLPPDNEELIRRYWAAQRRETLRQCRCDLQQQECEVDLSELAQAAKQHAGALEELAAIAEELHARDVDPRQRGVRA